MQAECQLMTATKGYQKGHPYHPPKDPTALSKTTRRRLANLSEVMRSQWPPEKIAAWLMDVMAGRDPDRPKPKDGDPDFGAVPIEWPVRMRAAKMYLDRAYGLPAQHLHLEASLAQTTTSVQVNATADLKTLDSAALEALRATLRQILPKPPTPEGQQGGIPVGAGAMLLPAPGAGSSGGDGGGDGMAMRDTDEDDDLDGDESDE